MITVTNRAARMHLHGLTLRGSALGPAIRAEEGSRHGASREPSRHGVDSPKVLRAVSASAHGVDSLKAEERLSGTRLKFAPGGELATAMEPIAMEEGREALVVTPLHGSTHGGSVWQV